MFDHDLTDVNRIHDILNINATAIYGKYFCTEGYLVKNFMSPAEILCVNVYVWKMVIIFRS